jgi:hypothetical protein
MNRRPCVHGAKVLGDLRLALQLERHGAAVDDAHPGVVRVELEHRVGIPPLDGVAQRVEVQSSGDPPFAHKMRLPCVSTFGSLDLPD